MIVFAMYRINAGLIHFFFLLKLLKEEFVLNMLSFIHIFVCISLYLSVFFFKICWSITCQKNTMNFILKKKIAFYETKRGPDNEIYHQGKNVLHCHLGREDIFQMDISGHKC